MEDTYLVVGLISEITCKFYYARMVTFINLGQAKYVYALIFLLCTYFSTIKTPQRENMSMSWEDIRKLKDIISLHFNKFP